MSIAGIIASIIAMFGAFFGNIADIPAAINNVIHGFDDDRFDDDWDD